MRLKLQSTVLITSDFTKMKMFYENVLNQEIEFDFGNCIGYKCGISIWELKPEYHISKSLGYTYREEGNPNIEICFETDNFAEAVAEIKKHNTKLLHDITEEPWGQKTIRLYDPDNNLIEIGETIKSFVLRFYNSGMTAEDIVKRTSVSLELVNNCIDDK